MKCPALIAAVILSLIFGLSNASLAQTLTDQAIVGTMGAGALYGASSALKPPMSTIEVIMKLQKEGYTNLDIVSEYPMKFDATSPAGMPVMLSIEPKSGKILSALPR
jgi:hypothetical protein